MSRQAELSGDSHRVQVVAGILRNPVGQVLISDRSRAASMQQYWEFPGGKVEPGESIDSALRRELTEELGIRADEFKFLESTSHDYPDLRVHIDFFIVSSWTGTPRGMEGQGLRWVAHDELDADLVLPADRVIVEALQKTC